MLKITNYMSAIAQNRQLNILLCSISPIASNAAVKDVLQVLVSQYFVRFFRSLSGSKASTARFSCYTQFLKTTRVCNRNYFHHRTMLGIAS